MLGYRTREPFVVAEDDHHILRGGGMLKPVVLNRGAATGTWSIKKGRPEPAGSRGPGPLRRSPARLRTSNASSQS